MTSPPTPTLNHSNDTIIISPPTILPSHSNTLLFDSPPIDTSVYNCTSFIDPFFSSCSPTIYNAQAISSSPNYASDEIISELDSSFQLHPKVREKSMTNNNSYSMEPTSHGEKPHTCPISQCSRNFKRLEHLKRHMRIHTLERPFQCTYHGCFKRFSRSDNLSQHIRTHWKHLKQ